MSRREATLCDLTIGEYTGPGPRDFKQVPCERLAIGVCIACGRDVCDAHTRRKMGALQIKLVIVQGADAQGPERVANEFTNQNHLCSQCETALMTTGTHDLITRIAASAHEMIRAQLAAKALT